MAGSRTYRKKYKELKALQESYYRYLTESEDPLPMGSHLKLINEISRLDRQISKIEVMNLNQLEQPVSEWDIEMNSELNKN